MHETVGQVLILKVSIRQVLYTKYYNDTDFWVEPADFVRLKKYYIGIHFS